MSQITNNLHSNNATIYISEINPVLSMIPKDIFKKIPITIKDIVHFALTCRDVVYLATDSQIWNFFLQRDFPNSWAGFKSEIKNIDLLRKKSLTFYKLLTTANRNIKDKKYCSQQILSHQNGVREIFIHDNKLISSAISQHNPFKVCDLNSQKELYKFPDYNGEWSKFVAHGNNLITYSKNKAHIYDLNNGQALPLGGTIRTFFFLNGEFIHKILAYDNKLIVHFTLFIKIYDLNDGKELISLDFPSNFKKKRQQQFNSDLKDILIADDNLIIQLNNSIQIYNLNKTENSISLDLQEEQISRILVSNNMLIVQLYDPRCSNNNKIKTFNLNNGKELISLELNRTFSDIQAQDNKLIVLPSRTGTFPTCTVYDLDSGQPLLRFLTDPISGAFVYDYKLFLVTVSDVLQIYDLNNGDKLQTIETPSSCCLFRDYKLMIGNRSNEIIDVLDFNCSLPVSSQQIVKALKLTGSQFKHLQAVPEEKTEDRCELEKRGLNKKEIVGTLLQNLCIAAEERATEIMECPTLFKEYNDWVGFKEKLIRYYQKE